MCFCTFCVKEKSVGQQFMKNAQRLASYRNLMFFCAKNETNGKYTTFITTVNNHQQLSIHEIWRITAYQMIRMEGRTTFDGHKVNTVPACSWRAFSREDWEVRHSCSSGEGMRPAGVVGPTPHNLACHQLESSLFIIYQMGTQKEFFFT